MLFAGGAQPEQAPIGVIERDDRDGRRSRAEAKDKEPPVQVAQAEDEPTRGGATAQRPRQDSGQRVGPRPEPPAITRDVFRNPNLNPPGTWDGFNREAAALPSASAAERFAYGEIFGVEGGVGTNAGTGASSGIMPSTLDWARNAAPGVANVERPEDLTLEQRAAIYRAYTNNEFRHFGGDPKTAAPRALESIGDPHAAAALADTVFMHGTPQAVPAIQKAINNVQPGRVREDKILGPDTVRAWGELARNPDTKGPLLDELARLRGNLRGSESTTRIDYFRYETER